MNINEVKFESFKPFECSQINSVGVRAIHIPTGMIAESNNEKTHFLNKRKSVHLLKHKLGKKP